MSLDGAPPTISSLVDSTNDLLASPKAGNVKTTTHLCGLTVGIVNGEPLETMTKLNAQCASAGRPAAQEKLFQKTAEIVIAIQSGQLDARFASTLNGNYIAQRSPESRRRRHDRCC